MLGFVETNFLYESRINSFFKNPSHHEQIFEIMTASYNSPIKVESWGRPYSLDSPTVKNVNNVTIDDQYWYNTQDHSKWGVFENESEACIGDLNHMDS